MKTLKILLFAFVMIFFAGSALAVTVTINGPTNAQLNGTYTLNSMTIDSNGNITLTVNGSNPPPPPPGGLSLSLNPSSLPSGRVGQTYNQTVTMSASGGTPSYTYSCSGSGVAGITASNSGSTCTISGTPTANDRYTVNFKVTDSASATAASSISFSISDSSGGTVNATDIGPRYPHLIENTIVPNGVNYYYFTLDRDVSWIVMYMTTSDWSTNQDMIVSSISQPKCEDIVRLNSRGTNGLWYNITTTNNEKVTMWINAKAGSKFYVTVRNRSATTGRFALYWDAN